MVAFHAPATTVDEADARIARILIDPASRFWMRSALTAALEIDPCDAANDAALLATLLGDRADAHLRGAANAHRSEP